MTPFCCGVEMWLHSTEDIRDRGGDIDGDVLAWECLECDRLEVVAVL